MSQTETEKVFPDASYTCVRCGTAVSRDELEELPSPRCANCGFTVFSKARRDVVKRVSAV